MGELDWRGEMALEQVRQAVAPAVTEIGLRIEAKAKRRLKKSVQLQKAARVTYKRGRKAGKPKRAYAQWVKGGGRGVRTGTLRRSIHTATPGYNWAADDTPAANNTPERGGREIAPQRAGDRLTLQVGSGMRYALPVHDTHYNSDVNRFLTKSAEEVRADVPGILAKHKVRGNDGNSA